MPNPWGVANKKEGESDQEQIELIDEFNLTTGWKHYEFERRLLGGTVAPRPLKIDPTGPSSLAAYQTCRVGGSFGRPACVGSTRDDHLDFAPWRSPPE